MNELNKRDRVEAQRGNKESQDLETAETGWWNLSRTKGRRSGSSVGTGQENFTTEEREDMNFHREVGR